MTKYQRVSRMILRQCPEIKRLWNAKRLPAKVFLDYLTIGTNLEPVLDEKLNIQIKEAHSLNYHRGFIYEDNFGHKFTVFSLPKKTAAFRWIIQLNPRSFSTRRKLEEFLSEKGLSPEATRVLRVDIAFQLSSELFSPNLLKYTGFFPWKRRTSQFQALSYDFDRGDISGMRTHGGPINLSCYDEKSKPKSERSNKGPLTKFEYQIRRKTLESNGIFTPPDLGRISDLILRRRLRFVDPVFRYNNLNSVQKRKLHLLQKKIVFNGFHVAKQRLSSSVHRNFTRDFKFLRPLCVNKGKSTVQAALIRRFTEWLRIWDQ